MLVLVLQELPDLRRPPEGSGACMDFADGIARAKFVSSYKINIDAKKPDDRSRSTIIHVTYSPKCK